MNFPIEHMYRLAPRGGAGLACDETGVALGATDLARVHLEAGGRRRYEVRPPADVGRVLKAAYGPQPDAVVQRLHRGLTRTARWLEAGDLCHAGVEAVMLGFPDLTPTAMVKLAEIADLEKRGDAWRDEPRLPAGQAGGGQWTTGGGGGGAVVTAKPVQTVASPSISMPVPRPEPRVQSLDDRIYGPAAASPPSSPYSQQPQATLDDGVLHFTEGQGPGGQPAIWDDGVYHFTQGQAEPLIATAAAQEEFDEEPNRRSNGPPEEFDTLQEVFPGLRDHPFARAILAPFDHFIGFSALADEMNLAATMNMYRSLVAQTKAIDPSFVDYQVFPEGGVAGLSWEGRANLINSLLMERASAYYRIRGDVRPLQTETVIFLRKTVDDAYADAVKKYNAGDLKPRLSREEAIGNNMDAKVRKKLRQLYNVYNIKYGNNNIKINNRDKITSDGAIDYRIPDARIGDISFDWTLSLKTMSSRQIKGFFDADARPKAVVIVRPSQYGNDTLYAIRRPITSKSPR
jgi:hypothetical protein